MDFTEIDKQVDIWIAEAKATIHLDIIRQDELRKQWCYFKHLGIWLRYSSEEYRALTEWEKQRTSLIDNQ